MENITYVTGNYGKYISVKEKFESLGIAINFANIDIEEPEINDVEYVSREKARIAYEHIKSPVFVVDSGFYIRSYPNSPNYPGAFVKRSGISNNIEELLNVMKDVKDRYCYFLECLTYYDGKEYISFFEKCEGNLSYDIRGNELKKAKSRLWYVFIPLNCTKTLAEMSDFEKNNRVDGQKDVLSEFANWLQNLKLVKKTSIFTLF